MASPCEAHGGLLGIGAVKVAIYCLGVFTFAERLSYDMWVCAECGKQVKVVW
jgi:hypothetical protein